MVLVSYSAAQQFQAVIALADSSYIIKSWQAALLTIAVTSFAIAINTYFMRKLPMIEGLFMVLHVAGFFIVVVILWVMGSRGDPKEVLTHFEDNAGWGNVGLACLIGLLGPVITLIGADSSCHLSEELRDAAWVLPRAMVATALVNYTMGFVMTVTLMFMLGDLQAALQSPTGQPYVEVLQNATQSQAGTIVLTLIVAIMMVFCGINQVTTTSRQLFAFARDGGLPFSKFLSQVSEPHTQARIHSTS
jgi:choline transport protein